MNDMKDVSKTLVGTNDGRSVIFFMLIFFIILIRSIFIDGLEIIQWKYIFFSLIAFLIFCKFRTGELESRPKTNVWGFVNVNGFCLFLIYLEFFND